MSNTYKDDMGGPHIIETLRKQQGLSQAALGRAVGVTQQTVADWESGVMVPRVEKLQKLAEALQTDEAELAAYLYGKAPELLRRMETVEAEVADLRQRLAAVVGELEQDAQGE